MRRRTVEQWRRTVYRSPVSDGTRVLLLLLADLMSADLTVSVPRTRLASILDRSERRITERITEAHRAGLLDTVVRGRKHVTATYIALFPELSGGGHAAP